MGSKKNPDSSRRSGSKTRAAPGGRERSSDSQEDRNIARLRQIVAIMEASSLSSLEYEDETLEVRLTRSIEAEDLAFKALPSASLGTETLEAFSPSTNSAHLVRAPVEGAFYRSPSPSAPPFVSVGDRVEKGQTLCMIEAMARMNEIEADVSGEIAEVLVDDAAPVQFGEPLLRIVARG